MDHFDTLVKCKLQIWPETASKISAKSDPKVRLNCLPALELGVVVHQHVHLQRRRVDAALAALLALHLPVTEKKRCSVGPSTISKTENDFKAFKEWLKGQYLKLH